MLDKTNLFCARMSANFIDVETVAGEGTSTSYSMLSHESLLIEIII